jgi:hypothetical protein
VGLYVFSGDRNPKRIARNAVAASLIIELFALGWFASQLPENKVERGIVL